MKKLILAIVLFLIIKASFGEPFTDFRMNENIGEEMQKIDESLSYSELKSKAIDYFREDSIDTAILYMEYALKKFPEEFARTTNILAYIYTRTNNLSNAIEIWEIGMNKGYIYDLNNPYYQEYYKDNTDFERLAKMEQSRLDTLHLRYEVILPIEFNNEKTYPILFIFHGNGRNIAKSKISWKAPIMNQQFITVFMQSYIPSSPTDFKWTLNDDKINKEFKKIYDNIMKSYLVDTNKIIFAGMSAGGSKVVEYAFNEFIPMSGLVLNCPVIPADIKEEDIKQFVEKNKKIGIITGENDFALAGQKKILSDIENLNGKTKIFVNKNLGHVFAEDFSDRLNEYLKWVIE